MNNTVLCKCGVWSNLQGDSEKRDGNCACMISVLISSFLFNVGCYRLEIKGARKKLDVFINLICIGAN